MGILYTRTYIRDHQEGAIRCMKIYGRNMRKW